MKAMMSGLGELRFEPTAKRVRALIAGSPVVDSLRAVLIWEPRRVVPSYAVPREDVRAELLPAEQQAEGASEEAGYHMPDLARIPVLTPEIPFQLHSTEGRALDLRTATQTRRAVAFELSDPDLSGYVNLDFDGFDQWLEEDEKIVSHPRDPFSRIDMRQSSRRIRVELDGTVLADSDRPLIVFETGLPVRYYLPPDDVGATLHPTSKRTTCAYKGQASYWSVDVGADRVIEDLAWSYPAPLPDATALVDLICFFDEKTDLIVDGVKRERPVTPWS